MGDAFFADIDWEKLEKRQLAPPQVLAKDSAKEAEKKQPDEEEMLFAADDGGNEQGSVEHKVFEDVDYTDQNKNF